MGKHLHASITSKQTKEPADPVASMQQLHMEQEFAKELAVVKAVQLEPRKEAVDQLLQLIAQQSVAEQH